MEHATPEELLAGLEHIRSAPADRGTVELIVRRPAENEREVLDEGELDTEVGLVGDRWHLGSSPTNDAQLTLMNARLAQVVARSRERWALAGDQLYVDFDLSIDNVPVGTRLAIGEAVIELSEVAGPKGRMFDLIRASSQGWDGSDPVRPFPDLSAL